MRPRKHRTPAPSVPKRAAAQRISNAPSKTAPLCILSIAGSDSGGGAGIQADIRTIHALGGYAATAITAVTAQNTRGVSAWNAVDATLIGRQVIDVCSDLPIAAIKTGLLPSAAAIRAVTAALAKYRDRPLVIDPVIGSTSGTRFLSAAGLRILLGQLIPLAALVTPNWPEAEALTGRPVTSLAQAELAGRALIENTGCKAVLVKGGHAPGPSCEDLLLLADGRGYAYVHRRIQTQNTHGTGCVLSAAIATRLGAGDDLQTAVETATDFLNRALQRGRAKRWGGGHGPAFAGLGNLG